MRLPVVLLVGLLLAPTHVVASPSSRPAMVGTSLGGRLTLAVGSPILGRASVDGGWRWNERWHAGARIAFELGADSQIYEGGGELGIVLHTSREIDVLLGWRVGYAHFRFNGVSIGALAISPVADIFYLASDCIQIRISPLSATAHHAGLWKLMVGPEVGVVWRF
ncbi:MAG: hypothetical protein ACKV2T_28935 [Kofleriaceae bacterium]